MSVGCGIFPLTWMCLCSLYDRARTAEESAPGAVHILFQPGTHRTRFSAVLQTLRQLVSCAGSRARAAAAQGTQGGPRGARGPGCANRGQWGHYQPYSSQGQEAPCPSAAPGGSSSTQSGFSGAGFGPHGKHDLSSISG